MPVCTPTTPQELRKIFWSTQPAAKGTTPFCGIGCGDAGLQMTEAGTIDNSNYVRGLALNILLTDGEREEAECGFLPGRRGGFWGDTFRADNGKSGSTFRRVQPTGSILETLGIIRSFMQKDLEKLVKYGVAFSVDVKAAYKGNGIAEITATIVGQNGEETRVGISGQRLRNQWAWNG